MILMLYSILNISFLLSEGRLTSVSSANIADFENFNFFSKSLRYAMNRREPSKDP